MAKRESHYVVVRQEGAAGATRGKISSATCVALGAEDGDVIEIILSGQNIVGGGVMSSKDAREYLREHTRGGGGSGKAKASTKKGKSTVSSSESPKKSKKKVKVKAKAGKRSTSVEYDEPRPKIKKKVKKGKFSLKK